MSERDKLIKNITIIEKFADWLYWKTNFEDYGYYNKDDNPDDENVVDALNRIVKNMEKDLEKYNSELLKKYKNKLEVKICE